MMVPNPIGARLGDRRIGLSHLLQLGGGHCPRPHAHVVERALEPVRAIEFLAHGEAVDATAMAR